MSNMSEFVKYLEHHGHKVGHHTRGRFPCSVDWWCRSSNFVVQTTADWQTEFDNADQLGFEAVGKLDGLNAPLNHMTMFEKNKWSFSKGTLNIRGNHPRHGSYILKVS